MATKTFTVVDGSKDGVLDITNHASVQLGNAAGTDFYYMPNDGKTVLVCVCGAAAKQLTFTATSNQYGRTESLTPTPTSSNSSVIGPFKPHLFNNSSGNVSFKPAAGGLATDHYLAVRVG